MAMKKTTQPYEFLVRWGTDGKLSGAHVQYLTRYTDGAEVISEKIGDAIPVGLDGSGDFPLSDVLSSLQADALTSASAAQADAKAVRGKLEEGEAEIARLTSRVTELEAQVAPRPA